MRSGSIIRQGSEGDESGCESDSSLKGSMKRVHFCGGCKEDDSNCDNSKFLREEHRCDKGKSNNKLKEIRINKVDIPDGSDIFRQVLREIKTEDSDDDVCTPRSDCDSPSKPLKSILKKHK